MANAGTESPEQGPEPGERATDGELVRLAQQGELEAFDELVSRHATRAYHAALAILGDHHDAQDVAQDAFLAAWRGLSGFRGDCQFGTWLHPIVTRRALNKASRSRATVSLDDADRLAGADTGPAEAAEQAAAERFLDAAMRELPAAQRSAITLHHLDGLSCAQIATLTSTTVPAVRSHMFRGRRALAAAASNWH